MDGDRHAGGNGGGSPGPASDRRTCCRTRSPRSSACRRGSTRPKPPRREPIAIVGMGCRAPGGVVDADGYWELLADGPRRGRRGAGRSLGRRRLLRSRPDRARQVAHQGRRLPRSTSTASSPAFFGISPREATGLDPQQRLLLEVAWEALEDAAIPADQLDGSLHRRVRRHHVDRLRAAHRRRRSGAQRHLPRHRHGAQRRGRPRLVHARPARSVHGDRHRLLVVAGRDPHRLPEPAQPRERPGAGRRRQRDPVARPVRADLEVGHAVAGRPLQDLRRVGQRLRARRRLRPGRARAAVRRASPTAATSWR